MICAGRVSVQLNKIIAICVPPNIILVPVTSIGTYVTVRHLSQRQLTITNSDGNYIRISKLELFGFPALR